jgi:4-hydroxybenzoyl-CoA reductase subunit beta
MMRLPLFRYVAPRTIDEVARVLAGEGSEASLLAGGTDLLPNMKRRQQTPKTVIGLRRVEALRRTEWDEGRRSVSLGACTTLTQVVRDPRIAAEMPALWQAASQVATPHLRALATLGGNLCLDTRCNYYDQSYEWRKAIGFCKKKDGDICWVATSSPRCLAVSSTDTAPALMALGARVRLVSVRGVREVALADLYRNDGIEYLARSADEILQDVVVELPAGTRSTYWKLRRRGAFDFPVLSVAAALRMDGAGAAARVAGARIVLGSVASRPLVADATNAFLAGKKLDDATIEEAASLAAGPAKPMDNTDFVLGWRKRVVREFVIYALRELRGDDICAVRERYVRHAPIPIESMV